MAAGHRPTIYGLCLPDTKADCPIFHRQEPMDPKSSSKQKTPFFFVQDSHMSHESSVDWKRREVEVAEPEPC